MPRLGKLQAIIVEMALRNNGVITMAEARAAIGGDRRRAYQSLKCLVKRGIMKRIGHGVYQLAMSGDNNVCMTDGGIMTLSSNNDARGAPAPARPNPIPARRLSLDNPGASSPGPSVSAIRVGSLAAAILSYLAERGLRRFMLSELSRALGRDRRVIHRSVSALVKKGIVKKVARGLYELAIRLEDISFKLIGRPARGIPVNESARVREFRLTDRALILFDNVRGYTISWRYVSGDRKIRLSFVDMINMREVKYAEVSALLPTDDAFRGCLVIYNNKSFISDLDGEIRFKRGVVVEWRPPGGYFASGKGLIDAKEDFAVVLLEGFIVIARALASLYGSGSLVKALRRLTGAGFARASEALAALDLFCTNHRV